MGNNIVRFWYNIIRLQFPYIILNSINPPILNDPQPCLGFPQLGTCVLNKLGEERLINWGALCAFEGTPKMFLESIIAKEKVVFFFFYFLLF